MRSSEMHELRVRRLREKPAKSRPCFAALIHPSDARVDCAIWTFLSALKIMAVNLREKCQPPLYFSRARVWTLPLSFHRKTLCSMYFDWRSRSCAVPYTRNEDFLLFISIRTICDRWIRTDHEQTYSQWEYLALLTDWPRLAMDDWRANWAPK